MTRSPWLIQTWWRWPVRPEALEQRAVLLDLDEGAAEFAVVGALDDLPPSCTHMRHLAVADAEHRHAGRRRRSAGARGLPMSEVEAGPPDRMTAFGLMRSKAASADWKGTISE